MSSTTTKSSPPLRSSKAYLKASEEVRARHALLKEMAKRTKQELEDKVSCGARTTTEDVASDERVKKECWYLEKLLNVLNVQEKLLDNRAGCTFQHDESYAEIMREMDKYESLIKEIDAKCSSATF